MKKKAVFFLIILFISPFGGFIIYEHSEFLIDNTKFLISDPAKSVLNANFPEQDTVYTFQSEVYGKINLFAGTEEKYGFRHILARHTTQYFINYDDKNENTFFDNEVTGGDIIIGIKEFYKHCVDVEPYNNHIDRNIAYVGYTKINGENVKCLLIVRKENKSIVTFYPFKEKREQEILDAIEEKKLEEQRERERKQYYYD